jgi:hypothetical protein
VNETRGQTWHDFEAWVTKRQAFFREKQEKAAGRHVSIPLFRGHSSASWTLATTLERFSGANARVDDYYRQIDQVQSSIESLTGQRWDGFHLPDCLDWLGDDLALMRGLRHYEYLVHLRHHGFPSPLLDWSRSPYVAAFFAFNTAPQTGGDVAIYSFMEYTGGAKSGSSASPMVHGQGPHVRTHKRHVLQQAEYTVCVVRIDDRWRFASHEDALRDADLFTDQDDVWKFTLPASLRRDALMRLDQFNLNAFSLFQTEDSLMETMALRAFTFGSKDSRSA